MSNTISTGSGGTYCCWFWTNSSLSSNETGNITTFHIAVTYKVGPPRYGLSLNMRYFYPCHFVGSHIVTRLKHDETICGNTIQFYTHFFPFLCNRYSGILLRSPITKYDNNTSVCCTFDTNGHLMFNPYSGRDTTSNMVLYIVKVWLCYWICDN